MDDRPQELAAELPGIAHERAEQPPPRAAVRAQAGRGRRHRPLEDDRAPSVERVRERRVGMDELDPARGEVDRSEERRGEVSGRIVEQTSCRNPGSVSSAVRVPPPAVGAASYTRTERPARASVMAAARPLGPAPTTIASTGPSPCVTAAAHETVSLTPGR